MITHTTNGENIFTNNHPEGFTERENWKRSERAESRKVGRNTELVSTDRNFRRNSLPLLSFPFSCYIPFSLSLFFLKNIKCTQIERGGGMKKFKMKYFWKKEENIYWNTKNEETERERGRSNFKSWTRKLWSVIVLRSIFADFRQQQKRYPLTPFILGLLTLHETLRHLLDLGRERRKAKDEDCKLFHHRLIANVTPCISLSLSLSNPYHAHRTHCTQLELCIFNDGRIFLKFDKWQKSTSLHRETKEERLLCHCCCVCFTQHSFLFESWYPFK